MYGQLLISRRPIVKFWEVDLVLLSSNCYRKTKTSWYRTSLGTGKTMSKQPFPYIQYKLCIMHDFHNFRYETMLRIQKRYSLRFRKSQTSKQLIRGFDMTFSSFPGGLQSGDDFYLMSSGLATLETTIDNYNQSLWSNVKPVGQV